MDTKNTNVSGNEIAVFGAGCFWCTEAVFKMLKGVVSVESGYGSSVPSDAPPTYESVASGTTDYVEVARIEYDPSVVSFRTLMTVFFGSHDATQLNRQGNDVGPQYRSVVFFTTEEQRKQAETFIAELNASASGGEPIVTTVEPLQHYSPAEEYHKDYYDNNRNQGYCQVIIAPKLQKVQKEFAALLKDHT